MLGEKFARRRIVALAVIATVVAALFFVLRPGNEHGSVAEEFADAWAAQEFTTLHTTLSAASQAEFSVGELTTAYQKANETATVSGIGVIGTGDTIETNEGDVVPIDVAMTTRLFGEITGTLILPVSDGGVEWAPHLVFPGLEEGEQLDRETTTPKRGSILARDGGLIAGGPAEARVGEIEGASQIAGTVAAPTGELVEQARERGFPRDAPLGAGGLELLLDELVAGRPGGTLIATGEAGTEVLAETEAAKGENVKTTIDPAVQAAATLALGAQFGGVAVLDEKGAVLGLAGLAFSAPQPPGSTFKVITAAAGLETGETNLGEEFPVVSSEIVGGREISNASDELCGGSLLDSFAHSCNTVFAPLGVRLGGEELVAMAERLGFNQEPDLLAGELIASGTAEPSTIPETFASDLDLGVSAIGQGQVLATPLGMASATQAVAAGGKRTPPYVYKGGKPEKVEAMSGKTARQMTAMMEAVVTDGTATAAAIPGVRVAGKTGTAELGPKPGQEIPPPDPENPDAPPPEIEMEVDAWFVAFAPAQNPQYVVAVMLVNAAGDGGEVAAPIARQILEALL